MAASFPTLNSPQRVGNVRNKVSLKPGRSLMDWIRLGNSGEDLQGFGGEFHKVSCDELSGHNTEEDVWISLRGRVYNITSYLEYHPGGIAEIMKGAGIDATQLFNEVHQWVNAESMLQKCVIGPLMYSPKEKKKSSNARPSISLSLLAPPSPVTSRSISTVPNDEGLSFWDCKVMSISDVTHNIKLFCFELPEGLQMDCPVGHHVHMKRTISGMEITRPYTVVVPSLGSFSHDEQDERHLFLIIKIYPSGTLTPSLLDLNIGERCLLKGYSGNFETSRLKEAKDICMIAGGTGLTPMARIIYSFKHGDLSSSLRTLKLLFANREEKDIIWKDQLDNLMKESGDRFQVFYFLSNPSVSWSGFLGRITESSLRDLMPACPLTGNERDLLIGVCGPDPFTLQQVAYLKSLGYQDKSIHAFLG